MQKSTPEELQLFNILLDAVNWLSALADANEADDQRYRELQRTLSTYHSLFPVVPEVGDEKIIHLIMGMIVAIVENIEIPTVSFELYHHLRAKYYCAIGTRNEDEYPSRAADLAWAKNALLAIHGQSWLSFHWKFYPTAMTLVVK